MTNLERLKLELSKKDYYSDEEYSVFLSENNLEYDDIYIKEDNQIDLLKTVIDIFQTLINDTDLMRKIDNKDIVSVDQAYKYLKDRIAELNERVLKIQEEKEGDYTNINLLFYNR